MSAGSPPDVTTVHLWVADLDPEPIEAARRLEATTQAERDRASRYRRPEDAHRYLYAHGVLRLILGDYLASDPVALRICTEENGKPYLDDGSIHFNLSHSGNLALIAVAEGRQVGVDVEQLRPMPDLDNLAARICGPGELRTLADLAEPDRRRAFFALWTRREALAKATGEGISAVFRDDLPDHVGQDRWTLIDINDLPGYAACVAAEGSGWQLVRRNVTESDGGP